MTNTYVIKQSIIKYCLSFGDTYEDYPYRNSQMAVMRCEHNKKAFAWVYEKNNEIWVNVKVDPQWRDFWRNKFESVIPGHHSNKDHRNTIILDGTVPDEDIKLMILESYGLVR
ncbi:MAG: MmcQ/YjbR family DNA-binding protein [Peptostreptococcaceae bacterium]